MSDISEKILENIENQEKDQLNNWISIVVALSATLLTLFNIKDNNIVQAMSQAQTHAVDYWNYYQSKGTKQNIAEFEIRQLELQKEMILLQSGPKGSSDKKSELTLAHIEEHLQKNQEKLKKYEDDKTEIKKKAEEAEAEYDRLNVHDDQFDLGEALISLGLSILGIAALTKKKSLFMFGAVFCSAGAIFGLAGFLGWSLHPDWIMKYLS